MMNLRAHPIVALSVGLSFLLVCHLQGTSRELLGQPLAPRVRQHSVAEKSHGSSGGSLVAQPSLELRKRLNQGDEIHALAFGPDGDLLAVACGNENRTRVDPGRIILWRTSTYERVGELLGHEVIAESVAFSPDGTKLLSGGEARSLILWDVRRLTRLAQLSGFPKDEPIDPKKVEGDPSTGITKLVFSPDGRTLVSHADQDRARFWDSRKYQERSSWIRATKLTIKSIAFKPNGSLLIASVGREAEGRLPDFELVLWDGSSPRPMWRYPLDSPGPVSFSPDGHYLATGAGDPEARERFPSKVLLEAANGKVLWRLECAGAASPLAFSPDSGLLAIGSYNIVRGRQEHAYLSLWETSSGAKIFEREVEDMINCLAFSPDGKTLATGHTGQVVLLWSIRRSAP